MRILSLILLLAVAFQAGNCNKDAPSVFSERERSGLENDTLTHPVVTGKKDSDSYTYLALGDSYTIGQSVPGHLNFPHQAVEMLKKKGWNVSDPDIIAVTGWTTDDLETAIQTRSPAAGYDVVSLLIGVNDQYVGYSLNHYRAGFEKLLKQAISFAKGNADHVVVLSIPDWGVTPFAAGRNRDAIAKEIDAFNKVNDEISRRYNVRYINITPDTRQMDTNPLLVASDGLHPSGDEYLVWSQKLVPVMADIFHD